MPQIRTLDVHTYQPHNIHGPDRIWAETNCYVDVVLELIHALGFNPVAALPFTLSIDYEGDQWTFFKYPPLDLFQLYGFELQELNPWDNLAGHIETQIELGRPVLVELDTYYLPDTAGTTYGNGHGKSTVAVNSIDTKNQTMGYFHGQSYYTLSGEDYKNLFQTGGVEHDRILPPYIELVKLHKSPTELTPEQTVRESLAALKRQMAFIPKENPFEKFRNSFEAQLPNLKAQGIEHFHLYSFATLRQFGACYELAATYLNWLDANSALNLTIPSEKFLTISQQSKTLQYQLARAVMRGKPVSMDALHQMSSLWDSAIQDVQSEIVGLTT